MEYYKMLKRARNFKGIKAKYVAEKLGVHITTYYELEAGRRQLTMERAGEIASILGMTLQDLLCFQVSDTLKNNKSQRKGA